MLVLFTMRKMFLIGAINAGQLKIMDCQRRKMDLQNYGTSLSDGKIDWKEMMSMPKNYIKRANHYIHTTQNPILDKVEGYVPLYVKQMISDMKKNDRDYCPEEQDYIDMEDYARECLTKRELEDEIKKQQKIIAKEEAAIDQEQKKLETQVNAYIAELKSTEDAEKQAIQQNAPKYVMA